MDPIDIVIARYNENLDWLFRLLEDYNNITAYIYNDGENIDIPEHIINRIHVYKGDGIPAEPSKYVKHIIEKILWNISDDESIDINKRIIFVQGDPIYHNPTFIDCLKPEAISLWNNNHQCLSLWGHPPPWGDGLAELLIDDNRNNNIPYIQKFPGGGKVWNDTMDSDMIGHVFRDPFIDHFINDVNNVDIDYLINYFNITRSKPELPMKKCFAACFSTTINKIKEIPLDTWIKIHYWLEVGCEKTHNISQKFRAILMEYLWAVLLE